jgi:hypothetical protein
MIFFETSITMLMFEVYTCHQAVHYEFKKDPKTYSTRLSLLALDSLDIPAVDRHWHMAGHTDVSCKGIARGKAEEA